jgi:hypothetical protein
VIYPSGKEGAVKPWCLVGWLAVLTTAYILSCNAFNCGAKGAAYFGNTNGSVIEAENISFAFCMTHYHANYILIFRRENYFSM